MTSYVYWYSSTDIVEMTPEYVFWVGMQTLAPSNFKYFKILIGTGF